MGTKVFIDYYKGYKIFAIWAVDKHGQKVGHVPLVSLGQKKCNNVFAHLNELQQFVKEGGEIAQSSGDSQAIHLKDDNKIPF